MIVLPRTASRDKNFSFLRVFVFICILIYTFLYFISHLFSCFNHLNKIVLNVINLAMRKNFAILLILRVFFIFVVIIEYAFSLIYVYLLTFLQNDMKKKRFLQHHDFKFALQNLFINIILRDLYQFKC